jgi:uncharacterized protein (DUF1015 family)
MGRHIQVGLVAAASCEEYLSGVIRKHEQTRPDKEEDRARHIEALAAQTGPAFLVYRAVPAVDAFVAQRIAGSADVDFLAADGVRHTTWTVSDAQGIAFLQAAFRDVPRLYIADGHHRSAAAARIYRQRHGAGHSAQFLAVIFPHHQVQILPYHRVVTDLNGLSPAELLRRLEAVGTIAPGGRAPSRRHDCGLYLAGRWHTLTFRPALVEAADAVGRLDVSLLQTHVLGPILGIDDPRTSQRLHFVGGIRGPAELQRLVDRGDHACAFALYPTDVEELMAIADAGDLLPPKSTWFEPKLRDGLFCHRIA